MRFALFFFFFLNFSLNWLFRRFCRIRSIRPESMRISPIQHDSAQVWAASGRVVEKKKKKTVRSTYAWTTMSLTRCHVGHGCGVSFSASVHPSLPMPFIPTMQRVEQFSPWSVSCEITSCVSSSKPTTKFVSSLSSMRHTFMHISRSSRPLLSRPISSENFFGNF